MTAALVQVRNVPAQVHRALKARAAERGESLNAYLLDLLAREVARPTVAEVLARAERRAGRAEVSVVDVLGEVRAERDEELARRLAR